MSMIWTFKLNLIDECKTFIVQAIGHPEDNSKVKFKDN